MLAVLSPRVIGLPVTNNPAEDFGRGKRLPQYRNANHRATSRPSSRRHPERDIRELSVAGTSPSLLGRRGLAPVAVLVKEQVFTKTANIWGVANNRCGTNTNRIVLFTRT